MKNLVISRQSRDNGLFPWRIYLLDLDTVAWGVLRSQALRLDKMEADAFYHWWYLYSQRAKYPITVEKVDG